MPTTAFRRARHCLLIVLPLSLAACASAPGASARLQPATDVPVQFQVSDADGSLRAPRAGEGCRNPLIDPRSQLRLVLQQSRDGWGDYQLPAGAYEARAGQWLRVDCATGKPLGLVDGG